MSLDLQGKTLLIDPLPVWARYADAFMLPLMIYVSGAPMEAPQETHRWNYQNIPRDELSWLNPEAVVTVPGDIDEGPAFRLGFIPFIHLPRWGGWKQYAVLEIEKDIDWYVGWRTSRVCGVSLLPITGRRVRCLIGDAETEFFAVDKYGHQLKLALRSRDYIGTSGTFSQVPLR